MIGLDTNVLVRLVVGDDPEQTSRAKRYIERYCTPESPGFINCVVLAELVWVLDISYGYGRPEIASVVEGLLAGGDRIIEHHDSVRASLGDYRTGKMDFADALISHINSDRGCETTATFDRKAAALDGFTLVA